MDFADFKRKIFHQFGINLDGYKEKQLKRRIDSLMLTLQVQGYEAYLRLLQNDLRERNRFLDRITINVSEFFRNPEIFGVLERQVLPDLLRQRARLKIWSAACSNGAEPYSVAIILDEITPGRLHRIDATDVDDNILEVARRGRYDQTALKNVTHERMARYFQQDNGQYQLREEIRRRVSFRHHDLLTQEYESGYDVILCRNVTIYFTADAQGRMYRQFFQALNPGGVLFIGATESILNYRELGYSKIAPWFYQKGA
ncbi:chemotaxis protein CheR [Clostridiales bacterium PH28_bin88]|nr:chemotaxis protein CheR [Clostridiales bacterium PH28_bin88]